MHPEVYAEQHDGDCRPRGEIPWGFFCSRYANIYDSLMADVPYESWVDYLLDVSQMHADRPMTIMDLACGTGTFALCAARRGLAVHGIDGSAAMIDIFLRKAAIGPYGERCTVSRSQLPTFPRLTSRYDAAVCFFDSLNYLVLPRAVAKTMSRVARVLRSGGIFVFDVNTDQAYRGGAFQPPSEIRLNDGTILRVSTECRYDSISGRYLLDLEFFNVVTNKVFVREHHQQRFYPAGQLVSWLRQAGFHVAACYRGFTLDSASETDDRWTFVAVKVE
jgi:SAM-dependent methyltransferase